MKFISLAVLLAVIAIASTAPTLHKPYYDLRDAPALFAKFVRDNNRKYIDAADKKVHYEAFVKKLDLINKSNAASDSAVFDINEFADYTEEDKKSLLGLLDNNKKKSSNKLWYPYIA